MACYSFHAMRMLAGAILVHASVVALCAGAVCCGTDLLYDRGLAHLMLIGGGLLMVLGCGMMAWGAYVRSTADYEREPIRPESAEAERRHRRTSHPPRS